MLPGTLSRGLCPHRLSLLNLCVCVWGGGGGGGGGHCPCWLLAAGGWSAPSAAELLPCVAGAC